MPRRSLPSTLRAGLLLLALAPLAAAGDDAPAPAPARAPAGEEARPGKPATEDVRWARSWEEATEEATERNVAIFLHSHGST